LPQWQTGNAGKATPLTISPIRTFALTLLALIAFAANSLLCRAALGPDTIDAASFTTIRLVSGAVMLWLIVQWRSPRSPAPADWMAAAMLTLYAIAFSFAYLSLSAGTGALILFGAVQLTLFAAGLRAGERLTPLSWFGFAIAAAGLVYLVSPGVVAPSPIGAGLMAVAGVAWGVYSLRGRGVTDPLCATAGNFLRSVPITLAISAVFIGNISVTAPGVGLAVISGAITSGVGYVIWYAALPGLNAMRAATVQLAVPAIAALGGVLLLAETVTLRLLLASTAILGGIAVVLLQRGAKARPATLPAAQ
jgi:drug/metabolite transporter (DMT)-like permease